MAKIKVEQVVEEPVVVQEEKVEEPKQKSIFARTAEKFNKALKNLEKKIKENK